MNMKVLWIDDQWKDQQDFIAEAEIENMDVTPAESHEEGMDILKSKLDFFDAVILDAKVKDAKSSTTTNLVGLKNSRDKLIELNKEHYLPFFIFTGQPDYVNSELFKQSYGEFYLKGEDNDKLFKDIVHKVSQKPEQKFRLKYGEVFSCFDLGILNHNSKKLLISNLENLSKEDYRKKNINVQRDLLESIFLALNNPIPCIPNSFILQNGPNQEWCTRFIEGRPTRDANGTEHSLNKNIPQEVKSAFRKIKVSSNGLSHLQENDLAKYPFLGNTFLLFELLVWLPKFVKTYYSNYI